MKTSYEKLAAIFAIGLMMAGIFTVPALARSSEDGSSGSSGSSGGDSSSGGNSASSMEDDIVDGDMIRGNGDENEIRGNGDENEARGNDDVSGDNSCSNMRRGRNSNNGNNGNGGIGPGERLEITSDSFNGSTEAKVKLDFVADSAGNEDIAKGILERLELNNSEVDSLLVMDDDMEDLVERTKVVVKEDNSGLRVRFEMRFPLDTDDRTAVVEGITARLGSLGTGDVTPENGESTGDSVRSNSRGILDDLSDFVSRTLGAIFSASGVD